MFSLLIHVLAHHGNLEEFEEWENDDAYANSGQYVHTIIYSIISVYVRYKFSILIMDQPA